MIAAVTGIDGFCGQAMSRFLSAQGVDVVGLRRSDFCEPPVSIPNAKGLVRIFERHAVDYVFHLAGTSHAGDKQEVYIANVMTAAVLFEALKTARRRPVVVLVGSAAEYGPVEPDGLPITEQQHENPVDSYGLSKAMQTRLGLLAYDAGHRVVISRPFNIIGAGMPKRLALGSFLAQISSFHGQGPCVLETESLESSRDFVMIDSAVRVWWELARQPKALGAIVNVCTGVPVTMQLIVEWMLSALPFPVSLRKRPGVRTVESTVNYGSPYRLHSLLGWIPPVVTAESIRSITQEHIQTHANIDHYRPCL